MGKDKNDADSGGLWNKTLKFYSSAEHFTVLMIQIVFNQSLWYQVLKKLQIMTDSYSIFHGSKNSDFDNTIMYVPLGKSNLCKVSINNFILGQIDN